MKKLLLPLLLVLTACATPPTLDVSAAPEGAYVLDPAHASVNWSLSHSGLSFYTARFDDISGALDFNPNDPTASRVDIRIDPISVSTGDPEWDDTLGTDGKYFDGEKHPEIRFISTSAVKATDSTGTVTGDLTLRGITKPVTLDVTYNGSGKSFGHPGATLGFSATAKIRRSDWGMDYLTNFGIGDEVTLQIQAEFNEAQ
ncbi:polyisoprenoid-binding protein [Litorimonas cladophorae]|uniref:Polyisoprenoid-binding protein n=1 Tax=Litorimonas cladophorae TaxID=1220491 RepID=A0A918N982_9PROT|nr:YceI family protein [Litorimonas cladophorae]GGX55708.1 polyisoprenoid-binding protein [Litorimonas cladophorae]